MTLRTNRRRFIEIVPISGLALLAACSKTPEPTATTPAPAEPMPTPTPAPAPATAAAPPTASLPMLDEKESQAQALGYVADATRADKARFPVYVSGNQCSNCAVYLGKAGDAAGACPIFPGKQVLAGGWCSAWVKKA